MRRTRTQPDGPSVEIEIKPRPWVRFWARHIDITIACVLLAFIILVTSPREMPMDRLGYEGAIFEAIFLWIFLEAFLLATIGTTPGKALLNVAVRTSGGARLSGVQALSRSARVWFFGLGAGLLGLFTGIVAHGRLRTKGKASWDEKLALTVSHTRVGTLRILATVGVFVALFAILTVVTATAASNQRGNYGTGVASAPAESNPKAPSGTRNLSGIWRGVDQVRTYQLTIQETAIGDVTGYAEYANPDGTIDQRSVKGSRQGTGVIMQLALRAGNAGTPWTFSGVLDNDNVLSGHWSVGDMMLAAVTFRRQ